MPVRSWFQENFKAIDKEGVQNYKNLWNDKDFTENELESIKKRKEQYMTLVNKYYDLVTSFYEWGWGHSFHFAPRCKWESRESGMLRHEFFLGLKMQMKKGDVILDLGCGVGGPARNIARFTDASIIGINNNDIQLKRAREITKEQGLDKNCSFEKADFMNIPKDDNSVDGVYQIEAACHSPEKVKLYKEIFRVMKPGAYFGGYEWVMTHRYDNKDSKHRMIKKGIEIGNGIADLESAETILEYMKEAGFEIIEHKDIASEYDERYETPYWADLDGNFSFQGLFRTKVGIWITHQLCRSLEFMKIAPQGTTEVSGMLMQTARELVEGGKLKIFTPALFVLCRKPEEKK